jgi:hypothetical protein
MRSLIFLSILVILIGWFVWNTQEGFVNPEVFHVQGSVSGYPYIFSKNELTSVCNKYGARGATYDDLNRAYNDNAEWCSTGWVSDKPAAYYPIQTPRDGCANEKTLVISTPTTNKAGVHCYGEKPLQAKASTLIPGETVMPFQYSASGTHTWNDPIPQIYTPPRLPDRYFETYQKWDGFLLPTAALCTQTSFDSLEEALRACDNCKTGCGGVTDFYGQFGLRKGVPIASGNSSYIKRPPPNYNYFLQPS